VLSRFWELAAGSLWFALLWHRPRSWPWLAKWHALAGPLGVVILAEVLLRASPQAFPMPWALGAVVGTLLLIGLPGAQDQPTAAALASRGMVWVGLRSYALYLWHWPILVLMRWTVGLDTAGMRAIAFALALLAAWASYRLVEQPIRRSVRWRALPHGVTSSLLVVLCAGSAWATVVAFQHQTRWSWSTVVRHADDWYAEHSDPTLPVTPGCSTGPHYRLLAGVTVIEHRPCGPATPDVPPRLFVLGDSHATAYLPMLHRLAVDERLAVLVYQVPGCPFLDLKAPQGEGREPGCLTASRAVLADVLSLARPGDSVFLASLRQNRFVDQWGAFDTTAVIDSQLGAPAERSRARALEDAPQWVQGLVDRGLPIIIEAPKPVFRAPPFRCVDPWTKSNPICGPGLRETGANELAYREPVLRAVEQFSRRTPGASVFDPLPLLCGPDQCDAVMGDGRPLFFDADHLSRYGNERVYPGFRAHWRRVMSRAAAPG
jgi:hypothetical protein